MRVFQRRRKLRFFFLRSANECTQACCKASLAWRSLVLRVHMNPLACLSRRLRRAFFATPFLTRVMAVGLGCYVLIGQKGLKPLCILDRGQFLAVLAHAGCARVFGIEMILPRLTLEDLAGGSDLDALEQGAV